MKQQLENIRQLSLEQIAQATTPAEIDDIRVRVLGKKGEVTAILKQMGKLSAEERPVMGALANEVREVVEKAIEEKLEQIKKELMEKPLSADMEKIMEEKTSFICTGGKKLKLTDQNDKYTLGVV